MSKNKFGSLMVGIGIGTGIGLLFAPKKGAELRKDLKNKMDDCVNKAKSADLDEARDEIFEKIENIKKEIEDLDKEKVLKIAKEKGELLKDKMEDLVKITKEKGTPILEKTAKEIKVRGTQVAKEVISKLEEKEIKESSK